MRLAARQFNAGDAGVGDQPAAPPPRRRARARSGVRLGAARRLRDRTMRPAAALRTDRDSASSIKSRSIELIPGRTIPASRPAITPGAGAASLEVALRRDML